MSRFIFQPPPMGGMPTAENSIRFGWGLKEFKGSFFDRPGVKAALDPMEHRFLNRFGFLVAERAKMLMVDAPKGVYSPPGFAPFAHVGLLRKMLYWAFDTESWSLIVGPSLLRGGNSPYVNFTVPEVLEYGGNPVRRGPGGGTVSARGVIRIYHYEARPYVRPAYQSVLRQQQEIWDYSLRPLALGGAAMAA